MVSCINIREKYPEYHVTNEETVALHCRDPWYAQIPCYNGHIGVYGGNDLMACTVSKYSCTVRLRRLPYITVTQDGDDGVNFRFPSEHFSEVAGIMRAKKKKRVSPETRERLRKMGFQKQ